MQFLNLFNSRRSASFHYSIGLKSIVNTPFSTLNRYIFVPVSRSYTKQRFLSFLIKHHVVIISLILTHALQFKRPKRLIAQSCILRQTIFFVKVFKFLPTDITKMYHTLLQIILNSSIFVFFFKNRIQNYIYNYL